MTHAITLRWDLWRYRGALPHTLASRLLDAARWGWPVELGTVQYDGEGNARTANAWIGRRDGMTGAVYVNVPVACFDKATRDSMTIHSLSRRPTLRQAQALVGGLVQLLELANGDQLLIHEEGRLIGLPVNVQASHRWPEWGELVGPVVYLTGAARWVD